MRAADMARHRRLISRADVSESGVSSAGEGRIGSAESKCQMWGFAHGIQDTPVPSHAL